MSIYETFRQRDDEDFEGFCSGCGLSCTEGICTNIDCLECPHFGEELDSPTLDAVNALYDTPAAPSPETTGSQPK